MSAVHHEKVFEDAIEAHLLTNGWLRGAPGGIDPETAIDREHLFAFLEATQGERIGELRKSHGAGFEAKFIQTLVKALESRGTLHLLRHGFKYYGRQIDLAAFKPAHGLSPKVIERYAANRLVVSRQVRFDPKGSDTLDLVLSLNGLPVATAELKTPSSGQTVRHAKEQYRRDRPPTSPILRFKRGALVHFAVDTEAVRMTTRLAGEKTFFLPLDKGSGGGAGNPPNPNGYRTSYLWEEIWERESFLEIVQRFLHLQVVERTELLPDGKIRRTKNETLIFPRYHQLDVVRRLERATRDQGAGGQYLIQHSAGSGKSNSIAWLAHRLQSLHDTNDRKIFHSVVVLTDRQVLDRQLQDNIYEIEHKQGVVARIDKDSRQLQEELESGTPIIISTIQKFPFVAARIDALPDRNYAVIVDEAHSSQSGEAAQGVREVLGARKSYRRRGEAGDAVKEDERAGYQPRLDGDEKGEENGDGEAEGTDSEEALLRVMESRLRQPNLSFYAFTATPKFKTLELFGQEGEDGQPRPFHLYTMRQAIEEGFILDVLKNYTTYKTFYRLANIQDDREVEKSKARAALARFVRLHPHNVAQKTEIMVEHFRHKVRSKVGGRAKAMVVASSRRHAVLYKEAFDAYLKEKGYTDVNCLVGFSGTVSDPDTGKDYTEGSMNEGGISGNRIQEAFATDEFRILLVANKFQTGFDQPLLHTMYVDKRLAGVQAVQTLSRLNRTAPGKDDTFVLDFVNEQEEILEAFAPYYEAPVIEEGVDPHRLYELQHELDGAGIYHLSEVEAFAKVFYRTRAQRRGGDQAQLNRWIQPAIDRFQAAEDEERESFRGRLNAYVNLYSFVSQVMEFTDRDLEIRYSFGRWLSKYLPKDRGDLVILDHDVELQYYRISQTAAGSIALGAEEASPLKGPTDTGTAKGPAEEKAPLSAIIALFNEKFGTDFDEAERLILEGVTQKLQANPVVQQQAGANTFENFSISPDVKGAATDAMVEHLDKHGELVDKFLGDQSFGREAFAMMMKVVYERLREAA